MNSRKLSSETGNALVEAVCFVTIAFGLVLSSGIELFEMQKSSLELQSIARNSLRSFLIDPSQDLSLVVRNNQLDSPRFRNETFSVEINCNPNCDSPSGTIQLKITSLGSSAEAFGVLSG